MSIRDKMRPLFRTLDGGLFSEKAGKADVGDAVSKLQAEGGTLMCWADPFYPDRVIPQKVLERSVEVIQQGVACHYTPPIGNADLKEVIAKKIERDNHIKVNPQRNIIINPGSDVGLYFAMTPFIEPGDEVLVHNPSYPSNFLDPQLLNGVVVKVPTYEEDNYRLRVEEYEKRLTPKTKMVLLSSPNNPTGRVFTREELTELSQFIIKHDLICVCDQAFEDTAFPGHEMVTMASLPGMWERTVTVCSCSKGMALSGYRVGYIFADDVIMDTMYATAVNIQGAANTMVQMAMIPAYEDTSFIQDYVAEQDFRRRYAYEKFNAVPGVSMPLMESGFYGWVNVSRLGDSSEITAYLAEEAKTLVNAGKFYGDQGAGHLRIIYGVFADRQKSLDGIDRLCEALAKRAAQLGITE